MWFVGWVLISCGFMVIKYNNVGGADSNIGGATPPQKGLTRTLVYTVLMRRNTCRSKQSDQYIQIVHSTLPLQQRHLK